MTGDRLESDRRNARPAGGVDQSAPGSHAASPLFGIEPPQADSAYADLFLDKIANVVGMGALDPVSVYLSCHSSPVVDHMAATGAIGYVAGGLHNARILSGALERNWRQFSGHDDSSPETALRQVRARTELCGLAEVRAVRQATKAGLSQRAIAKLLGTSQTNVHRLLRQSRAVDDRRGPREVILCYVAGEISRGALIGSLSDLARGSHPEDGGDGYLPGTWDEVRAAFLDGLLAETDYEELRAALRAEGAGSVG